MANPLGVLGQIAGGLSTTGAQGAAGGFQGMVEGEDLRRKYQSEDQQNALRALEAIRKQQQIGQAGQPHEEIAGNRRILRAFPGGPIISVTEFDPTKEQQSTMAAQAARTKLDTARTETAGQGKVRELLEQQVATQGLGSLTAGQRSLWDAIHKPPPEAKAPSISLEHAKQIASGLASLPAGTTQAQWRQHVKDEEASQIRVAGGKVEIGERARQGAQSGLLTPETVDREARAYLQTRQLPGLGFGGFAGRAKIMNRATEIAKEEGIAFNDLPARQAAFRASQSELTRLQGQRGLVMSFAVTADKNLGIAQGLSDKIERTGMPILNAWLQAGRHATGDPQVDAFNAAVRVAINETARVTSGQVAGVSTDTARKEIEAMLNTAQTPAQFKAVVQTLRQDMENRNAGYKEQIQTIQDSMKSLGAPRDGATTPTLGKPRADGKVPVIKNGVEGWVTPNPDGSLPAGISPR